MRSTKALPLVLLAALLLVPFAYAPPNSTRQTPGTRIFLIGTDFLCGLDPSACPAIAMADNGDTVEITGGGTLSIHPKSVTGGGTFEHNFAGGGSISGTWAALELKSFRSYGTVDFGGGFILEGGLALILVELSVGGTPVATGILQVDCVLGPSIPAAAIEGVRLAVEDTINFNQEVSGFTVYIPV